MTVADRTDAGSPERDREGQSAAHIDPDLRTDVERGWAARLAASIVFLVRCVR